MIIFKDLVSGKEMFTDALKIEKLDKDLDPEGHFIKIVVRKIKKSGGIDERLIGGNASAEGGDEQVEDGEEEVFQCKEYEVDNCPWDFDSQKDIRIYLKGFLTNHVKALKARIAESSNEFETNLMKEKLKYWQEHIKNIMQNFAALYDPSDDSVFSHSGFVYEEKNQPLFIAKWVGDDGKEIHLITIKECFEEEKV